MNINNSEQLVGSLKIIAAARIVFFVEAFEACRAFYESVLQLPIDCEWDHRPDYCGPAYLGIVYKLGQAHLELLKGDKNPTENAGYLYIPVADVDAVWEWVSKRACVVDSIKSNPWGHRNFTIADPAGIKLKFFSETKG